MSQFDGFSISFPQESEIVRHSNCCRCEQPAENSPVGSGKVPVGPKGTPEQIKKLVICLDCLELMELDPKKFWYSGWPNHRK